MFNKITLKNGTRILLENMEHSDVVTIGLWFDIGSANESREINGYTHFIEHMLFKGTKKYSAFDIVKMIEGVGGVFNAFTSRDYTVFYISLLSEYVEKAIDILCEILEASIFDEEDIRREKRVISEEIRMCNDDPNDIVADQFFSSFYSGTNFSLPIAGNLTNIKNINRDGIVKYFNDMFTSKNLVISVAGSFDSDTIISRVEGLNIKSKKNTSHIKGFVPNYRCKSKIKKDLSQVYFSLISQAYKSGDVRNYALNIFNNIFGSSSSSRLFQKLREKEGLCYNIYGSPSAYKLSGIYEIYASTSMANYKKVLELVNYEIDNLLKSGVSDSEISDAKQMYKCSLAFNKMNTSFIMNKNARQEYIYQRHYAFDELYDNIEQVTIKDIKNVIEDIFSEKKFFLSVVGPTGSDILSKKIYKLLIK